MEESREKDGRGREGEKEREVDERTDSETNKGI